MNSRTGKKHRPFSTGSQYNEWTSRNCGSCKKAFDQKPVEGFRCDWEKALCVAFLHNGQVSEEVAKAIGYLDNKECIIWECPGWTRGRKGNG